ncbi:phage replisome organizer N-terminal domain-containing protein [Bacillus altitudinis]|uniref:phage replisome organizer N-terminal domain-containing protein n=1 Tax=Bacillus altitudinis TaxID=293387 RepID=UPI001569944B|nr:phage replisome organizer N-terminal domain-containing protein [Bacillus altitudinis]QKJ41740.1 phage replisome organizer N-terminal domain-containing protein [Bacillus altitudinis]
MAEIKFIKLSTQMFDDEKIKLIEQLPESDTLLIIWIKLLAQAGKTNASGFIFLSENVPYTEEMLAAIFNRPIGLVRMALDTFRKFGMVEINEQNYISICNWEKHQNVDAMDKIREDTRRRVARHREKQKSLTLDSSSNVTCNVTVTQSNEQERRSKKEEVRKKNKDILSGNPTADESEIPFKLITDLLNQMSEKNYRHTTPKTQQLIKARWNEGFRFDDFKKVILAKCFEWRDNPEMSKFLRPETLFGTKFEGYLNNSDEVIKRAQHKGGGSRSHNRQNDLPF